MEPIHILGAGAFGMFWASSIRTAFPSYPLAALLRPQHKRKFLQNHGTISSSKRPEVLVCTMQNRRPRMASVPVEFIGDDRKAPIRNLILATKAYQAEAAWEGILPRLQNNNRDPLRIFILSDGALDVREKIQLVSRRHGGLPPIEYIMCTTTQRVIREENYNPSEEDDEPMIHLSHVGHGRTFLGGVPAMAQLWDHSGLNSSVVGRDDESSGSTDAMEVLLWKMLTANCICNPLTALWGVTHGELLRHDEASRIRKQIVQEIFAVAQGLHPSRLKEDFSETIFDSFVEQVMQDNLKNRSSMYYDIKQGRRTEVDSLNGYVVRKANEVGIDTPTNLELLHRIQDLEKAATQNYSKDGLV